MSELVLPEGLAILALQQGADHDHVVVSVHTPKRIVEEVEEVLEDEVGEEEAGTEEGEEDSAEDES